MTTSIDVDQALRALGYQPPKQMAPGISDGEWRQLLDAIQQPLPDSLRELYSYSGEPFKDWTCADGSPMPPLFPRFCNPLRFVGILTEWRSMREIQAALDDSLAFMMPYETTPDDVFKACNRDPGWIPIGRDGTNCLVILDLVPGPAGKPEQLFWFDGETSGKVLLAPDLETYLAQFIDALKRDMIRPVDRAWVNCQTGKAIDNFV